MFRSEPVRYLIAGAFAICGAGLVICANRAAYLRTGPGWDAAGKWDRTASVFGVGIIALLAIALALVIDAIVRRLFKLRARDVHFSLRTLLIAMTLFAAFFALYGALIR